jgi:hypothetical protein
MGITKRIATSRWHRTRARLALRAMVENPRRRPTHSSASRPGELHNGMTTFPPRAPIVMVDQGRPAPGPRVPDSTSTAHHGSNNR